MTDWPKLLWQDDEGRWHDVTESTPPDKVASAVAVTPVASPSRWPGDLPGGVPGVTDRDEVGPIGAGTPHARMEWFWERMRQHEELIASLTKWHPFSSTYRFEAAIGDAFDELAKEHGDRIEETRRACGRCGGHVMNGVPGSWEPPYWCPDHGPTNIVIQRRQVTGWVTEECEHDWKDAENSYVPSGVICTKCGSASTRDKIGEQST